MPLLLLMPLDFGWLTTGPCPRGHHFLHGPGGAAAGQLQGLSPGGCSQQEGGREDGCVEPGRVSV